MLHGEPRGWGEVEKTLFLTIFLFNWSSTCQIRDLYKQRLDEVEMLERHIIQARARALAEKERAMHQAKVQVLEPFIKMPPGVYDDSAMSFILTLQLLTFYCICSVTHPLAFF